MACAPSEDSDQPGHLPILIRVFVVRMKKAWVLSYPLSAQQRLSSDWADDQADLSLCWMHMPCCWFCHVAAHLYCSQITVNPQITEFYKTVTENLSQIFGLLSGLQKSQSLITNHRKRAYPQL